MVISVYRLENGKSSIVPDMFGEHSQGSWLRQESRLSGAGGLPSSLNRFAALYPAAVWHQMVPDANGP